MKSFGANKHKFVCMSKYYKIDPVFCWVFPPLLPCMLVALLPFHHHYLPNLIIIMKKKKKHIKELVGNVGPTHKELISFRY